jgi:hypothetical protein
MHYGEEQIFSANIDPGSCTLSSSLTHQWKVVESTAETVPSLPSSADFRKTARLLPVGTHKIEYRVTDNTKGSTGWDWLYLTIEA